MICLYLYEYLLLCNIPYIIGNSLISTFQCKFDCVNLSSHSWDISKQRFYSYWWSNILVVCCCFCTFHICADSLHLGLFSATYFVKSSLLVVEIQAEWSLWHQLDNSWRNLRLCNWNQLCPGLKEEANNWAKGKIA